MTRGRRWSSSLHADPQASSQKSITATANRLDTEAWDTLNSAWSANPERAAIQSEMRVWMRENATSADGIARIKDAVLSNAEFAAILHHSPWQLLGLSAEVQGLMTADAVIKHLPQVSMKLSEHAELTKIAGKYPAFIQRMHRSFYNPAVAELAKKRVTTL